MEMGERPFRYGLFSIGTSKRWRSAFEQSEDGEVSTRGKRAHFSRAFWRNDLSGALSLRRASSPRKDLGRVYRSPHARSLHQLRPRRRWLRSEQSAFRCAVGHRCAFFVPASPLVFPGFASKQGPFAGLLIGCLCSSGLRGPTPPPPPPRSRLLFPIGTPIVLTWSSISRASVLALACPFASLRLAQASLLFLGAPRVASLPRHSSLRSEVEESGLALRCAWLTPTARGWPPSPDPFRPAVSGVRLRRNHLWSCILSAEPFPLKPCSHSVCVLDDALPVVLH